MTTGAVPLSTLLSMALVGLTIEVDDAYEAAVPHRTAATPKGTGTGAWLTSVVMWGNLLRYVQADGSPLADLAARTELVNLAGLERWGYVRVEPAPGSGSGAARRRAGTVHLRPSGRRAVAAWPRAIDAVEARWRDRFGPRAIDELVAALATIDADLDPALPDLSLIHI